MPRSEAQKKADRKYQNSDYYPFVSVGIHIRKTEAEALRAIAARKGMSVSELMKLSTRYCVKNNIYIEQCKDIELTEFD